MISNYNSLKLFIIPLLLFQGLFSFGQINTNHENYYKWFDTIVGLENTGLFNGTRYIEKYRTRNGDHKFYHSSSHLNGNIKYDGQTYYGIELKYDIYEDQIIVNLPFHSGFSIFQLIDKKVNGFFVNDTEFIAISDTINNDYGFYEIIFQSPDISLYKKFKKIRNEYIYQKTIYNKYKDKNYYLLFSQEKYNIIKSHKDIAKLYPEHRSKFDSYFKKQKRLKKSNYNLFMEKLMISLSDILNQNTIPR